MPELLPIPKRGEHRECLACAAAWDKVFEVFDKADVRGVELAAILTPERRK